MYSRFGYIRHLGNLTPPNVKSEEGSARRGNAAIKPRAESSSLELCRGGAGKTEGQSHTRQQEIPTSLSLLGMNVVGVGSVGSDGVRGEGETDNVIARRAMPDVAISYETAGDPHVAIAPRDDVVA